MTTDLEPIGHLVELRREVLRVSFSTRSEAHNSLCNANSLLRAIQGTFKVNSENWNLYHQECASLGQVADALYTRLKNSPLREPTKGTHVYVPEGKVAKIEDAPVEEMKDGQQ